jgi:UDP-2,3-diacylglucosamine pyrophosphatase LpxH
MRLAAFGDLHLGHHPRLDKFAGREDFLLHFCDHLEQHYDRVILLGDIYQTDYGPLPGSRPDVLSAVLERYPRISRRWSQAPYQHVFGNHDLITRSMLDAPESLHFEDDGWRVWLIHGHQFDPLIGRGMRPYRVTWFMGGLRRLGLSILADVLEGPVFVRMQRAARRLGALDVTARALLETGQHDVVVMGHSHLQSCAPFGDGVYANSGMGTPFELPFVSIDTAMRRVEVQCFHADLSVERRLEWQAPSQSSPQSSPQSPLRSSAQTPPPLKLVARP